MSNRTRLLRAARYGAWIALASAPPAVLDARAAEAQPAAASQGADTPQTLDPSDDGGSGITLPVSARSPGPIVETARPPDGSEAWPRACSLRHPICVAAPPSVARSAVSGALDAADRSWDTVTGALHAPPPDGGLDGLWEIYLVPSSAPSPDQDGTGARFAERDPVARFDRGWTFATIDSTTPAGCALDLALARAVVRASLWRAAPATDRASGVAETDALAHLVAPCAPADDDASAFARWPERAVVDPGSIAFDRGASRFFDWIDATFGVDPGALLVGLWALAPTRTPGPSPDRSGRWAGAPTAFDVLRVSLRNALWRGSTFDDVLVHFAVARASMTPGPRLAWHVPWPARARRLASPEPVAPTGASYVVVDHAGASAGSNLRLEAEWEDFARMRWVVLKLDAAGQVLAELPITAPDRGTRASMTVEGLDGVDRVLVVGVHVGSTEGPFDPDDGEWEPHGWLLTVDSR